jgi:hypothetical protein
MDGIDQQAIEDASVALQKMHEAGYIMRDQVQIGMGSDGKVRFFDVGEATKADTNSIYAKQDRKDDFYSLTRAAEKAGLKYTPPDDRDPNLKWETEYENAHRAIAGNDQMQLFDSRMELKKHFGVMRHYMPDIAALYEDDHKDILEKISARYEELKPSSLTKKSYSGFESDVKAIFTRAVSERDGDGDGLINDGTPQDAPVGAAQTQQNQYNQDRSLGLTQLQQGYGNTISDILNKYQTGVATPLYQSYGQSWNNSPTANVGEFLNSVGYDPNAMASQLTQQYKPGWGDL